MSKEFKIIDVLVECEKSIERLTQINIEAVSKFDSLVTKLHALEKQLAKFKDDK